jgi:hypothetical protein
MYRREKDAQAALASDDPTALCRLGCPKHEPVNGRRDFFKYMSGSLRPDGGPVTTCGCMDA